MWLEKWNRPGASHDDVDGRTSQKQIVNETLDNVIIHCAFYNNIPYIQEHALALSSDSADVGETRFDWLSVNGS